VHHAGAMNVADIFADAAQQPEVFFALNSEPMGSKNWFQSRVWVLGCLSQCFSASLIAVTTFRYSVQRQMLPLIHYDFVSFRLDFF
jgi:hypothetical protein